MLEVYIRNTQIILVLTPYKIDMVCMERLLPTCTIVHNEKGCIHMQQVVCLVAFRAAITGTHHFWCLACTVSDQIFQCIKIANFEWHFSC
jgi:hypothetical protein